jgi:hypothetical protein
MELYFMLVDSTFIIIIFHSKTRCNKTNFQWIIPCPSMLIFDRVQIDNSGAMCKPNLLGTSFFIQNQQIKSTTIFYIKTLFEGFRLVFCAIMILLSLFKGVICNLSICITWHYTRNRCFWSSYFWVLRMITSHFWITWFCWDHIIMLWSHDFVGITWLCCDHMILFGSHESA